MKKNSDFSCGLTLILPGNTIECGVIFKPVTFIIEQMTMWTLSQVSSVSKELKYSN